MKKNLTVIGNSLGIIIEKPILDLLGIDKESQLEIVTDGKRLIIEPVDENEKANQIREATRRVMKNHKETLKKLAQ